MKAIDLLKAFDGEGLDASDWQIIGLPDDFDTDAAEWVRYYFGGDIVAGAVDPGDEYVAIWACDEYNNPRIDARFDAIVTNEGGTFIYLYKLEA